jgi:hypothetical protein
MNVKITGIDHVVKAIARKKEGVKVKIHTGLVKAAYVILSKARYYCPISPAGSRDHMGNWQPPGALRASGQVLSVERPGFGSEARVSFGGLAAFYALVGPRTHRVRPRIPDLCQVPRTGGPRDARDREANGPARVDREEAILDRRGGRRPAVLGGPMTTTDSPASILATFLAGAGIGLTRPTQANPKAAWQLSVGLMPPSPPDYVALFDTSPKQEGRDQRTKVQLGKCGFQVRLRANRYPEGWAKLTLIQRALENVQNDEVVVNGTTYMVHAVTLVSGPLFLGNEENQTASLFTMNLIASITEN